MRRLLKRMITVVLVLTCILVSACGKGNKQSSDDSQTNTISKGRYLEEELTLPGAESVFVHDLIDLEDGTYRIITDRGVYDSIDQGQTWNQLDQVAKLGGNIYISAGSVSRSGEILLILYDFSGVSKLEAENYTGSEAQYYLIDKDGNENKLNITLPELEEYSNNTSTFNGFSNVTLNSSGDIVGTDMDRITYIIDCSTGEIKNTFSVGQTDTIKDFICVGERLIVSYYDGSIATYDMSTGELVDTDKALSNELAATSTEVTILGRGVDEESVNFVNSSGIYHYTLGGTVIEELVNGGLNSISSPEYIVDKIVETTDNSFLLLVMNPNTWKTTLLKFTYSEDADATPSTEIMAYSLYDNDNIRQAIATYQKDNPDVYINLEIGVSDDNAVTASDAIKTLNTNIIAGNGPDVLILDGIPIDSYIEKGLLLDISDVLEEVSESDGVFENITNTYQIEDKNYAIPTRFKIPVIVGAQDTLNSINNLTELANVVDTLQKENPDKNSILNYSDLYVSDGDLLEKLYSSSSYTWLKEDGTLDKAELGEFLEQTKKIYDTYIERKSNKIAQSHWNNIHINSMFISYQVLAMSAGSTDIGLFDLTSMEDFTFITSLINSLENSTYDLAKGQSDAVFIPITTVGVSAKSENIDSAKAFIKALLSAENQKSAVSTGFPVNKKAFDDNCVTFFDTMIFDKDFPCEVVDEYEDGTSVSLEILRPDDEQIAEFKNKIESLTQSSNTNVTIQEVVLEEAKRCLEGEVSVDDAADNIITKINLYLSE